MPTTHKPQNTPAPKPVPAPAKQPFSPSPAPKGNFAQQRKAADSRNAGLR